MGQLKSDFDVEKFTVRKEGNFLAHNFHFLMRQYSITLTELRRMILNREEMSRYVKKFQKLLGNYPCGLFVANVTKLSFISANYLIIFLYVLMLEVSNIQNNKVYLHNFV